MFFSQRLAFVTKERENEVDIKAVFSYNRFSYILFARDEPMNEIPLDSPPGRDMDWTIIRQWFLLLIFSIGFKQCFLLHSRATYSHFLVVQIGVVKSDSLKNFTLPPGSHALSLIGDHFPAAINTSSYNSASQTTIPNTESVQRWSSNRSTNKYVVGKYRCGLQGSYLWPFYYQDMLPLPLYCVQAVFAFSSFTQNLVASSSGGNKHKLIHGSAPTIGILRARLVIAAVIATYVSSCNKSTTICWQLLFQILGLSCNIITMQSTNLEGNEKDRVCAVGS